MKKRILLRIAAVSRILLAAPAFLLFLALLLWGCLLSGAGGGPPITVETLTELTNSVTHVRQLPLKRAVVFETLDTSINRSPQIAAADYHGAMPLAPLEIAYKSIGLISNSADFRPAYAEYRRLEQSIVYEESRDRTVLSRDIAALGASLEKADRRAAAELPVVFAVTTALQEQHFKWRVRVDGVALEDRRLAFRAVAAGDALVTLRARAAQYQRDDPSLDHYEFAGKLAAEVDKQGARLPAFFRRLLSFPYREGGQFVYWAYKAKGWDGVNGLYANPPLSAAQILHPEKYFARRELPLRFFPAALLRRFKESPIVEQSFGEYLIRGLLATEHSAYVAENLAATWRGDQLFTFQQGANFITVWFSSWKEPSDAREFVRAYRRVLENRQRVRFERAPNGDDAMLVATLPDRSWLLQVVGRVVLLLNTRSANQLIELADHAWQDLEIETESTSIPFESARRTNQFSVRSR